jgi:hypothetical protein
VIDGGQTNGSNGTAEGTLRGGAGIVMPPAARGRTTAASWVFSGVRRGGGQG